MRRAVALAVLLVGALAGALVLARADAGPIIRFDETVPDDLGAVASAAWDDFLAAHPHRLNCIQPVTLTAAWQLGDRAEYRPETATITLRVPGTAPNLSDSLVHEFAHHVEFTCPEHEELRGAFLEAQGFPATADWFEGSAWETTPSEQYAEATVEMVLGRRAHRGGIIVSDEAVAVVRQWGSQS
jgi:hypothetical protein